MLSTLTWEGLRGQFHLWLCLWGSIHTSVVNMNKACEKQSKPESAAACATSSLNFTASSRGHYFIIAASTLDVVVNVVTIRHPQLLLNIELLLVVIFVIILVLCTILENHGRGHRLGVTVIGIASAGNSIWGMKTQIAHHHNEQDGRRHSIEIDHPIPSIKGAFSVAPRQQIGGIRYFFQKTQRHAENGGVEQAKVVVVLVAGVGGAPLATAGAGAALVPQLIQVGGNHQHGRHGKVQDLVVTKGFHNGRIREVMLCQLAAASR